MYLANLVQWNKIFDVLKQYLWLLLLGILAIIIGVWFWYHAHEQSIKQSERAAETFHQLIEAHNDQDLKTMKQHCHDIIKNAPSTIYADWAGMILAKIKVQNKQYQAAMTELARVAHETRSNYVKQLAQLRLGRLYIYENHYQLALTYLSKISINGLKPWAGLEQSEAYRKLGKTDLADKLYRKAANELGNDSPLLKLVSPRKPFEKS